MALEAFQTEQQKETGINAAFMSNYRGEICIAFSDPVYTRADSILLDKHSHAVHVIIHGNAYLVTHVSDAMANVLENNREALLTAIRPDGTLLELTVPIEVGNA